MSDSGYAPKEYRRSAQELYDNLQEANDVRNGALEEAARAVEQMPEYSGHPHAPTLYRAAQKIRALKKEDDE